ncbi:IQ domain-containing protein E-like [Oscarella lobularis]|uniref:IQ domain-containing protein E-like n=1 Tax=Oscarella lobularis TaxID=121494 RepID=UPI003313F56B
MATNGYSDDAYSEVSEEIATISVGSLPRPPSKPKNVGRSVTRRSSKIVSPYAPPRPSAPTPGSGPRGGQFVPGKKMAAPTFATAAGKTAREHWLSALRADRGRGLSSEGTKASTWMGGKPESATSATAVTSYLKDLMTSRSSDFMGKSMQRTRTRSAAGLPGLKSQEDMYDEIQELKRVLVAEKESKNILVTRVRRQEEELLKKDKQIEDMLSSGQVARSDLTRTLTQRRTDSTAAAVTSLKQQVHSIERALREKEAAYNKLAKDLKTTNIQELEIQAEMYYSEVLRLRRVIEERPATTYDSKDVSKETRTKMKALNAAVIRLSASNKELESENACLKGDLERAMRTPQGKGDTLTKTKGAVEDKYADYNRSQMLSRLVQLEMEVESLESRLEQSSREASVAEAGRQHDVQELEGSHSELKKRIAEMEESQENFVAERTKLRNVIRKLKEDRAFYRTAAETTESSVKDMEEKLRTEREAKETLDGQVAELREIQRNDEMAREHAAQRRKRHLSGDLEKRDEQHRAAVKLQDQWRKHKANKRQTKFEQEQEEAAVEIQSVFRGHLNRKKRLTSMEKTLEKDAPHVNGTDDDELDETATDIQSAIRGHLARKEALSKTQAVYKWNSAENGGPRWNSFNSADGSSFQEEFLGDATSTKSRSASPPASTAPNRNRLSKNSNQKLLAKHPNTTGNYRNKENEEERSESGIVDDESELW